jgi:hypothetical protein
VTVFHRVQAFLGQAAIAQGALTATGHDRPCHAVSESQSLAGEVASHRGVAEFHDLADHLVPEDRWDRDGATSFKRVAITAADRASDDSDKDLRSARSRARKIAQSDLARDPLEHGRSRVIHAIASRGTEATSGDSNRAK